MYYPTIRPQLTGISTQSVDCGVRATQMGLDWLSKGKIIPGVKRIRTIMNDQDATNYNQWDEVIDRLGGETMGFSGEKTNDFSRVVDHMAKGGAAILAVDYGVFRKSAPAKSGSLTFDGFHAILYVGQRKASSGIQWRSYDSLLDGRYRGCPNGPVWVPRYKIRRAAGAVSSNSDAFAVLLHRDPSVAGTEPGDLLPDAGASLADVLSDLHEVQAVSPSAGLAEAIDDLEILLGITGNPEADATTTVKDGVRLI